MRKKCEEIDELQLYSAIQEKIREVAEKVKRQHTPSLVDNNGKIILDPDKLTKHWYTCKQKLFESLKTRDSEITTELETPPEILKEEVKRAVKNCKAESSVQPGEIHREIINYLTKQT